MPYTIRIVVQVPPPPYAGECVAQAPPVDWSKTSSLVIRDGRN